MNYRVLTSLICLAACVFVQPRARAVDETPAAMRDRLAALLPRLAADAAADRQAAEAALLAEPFAARRLLQPRVTGDNPSPRERALYEQIGRYVVPGADTVVVDALLKITADQPFERAPWQPFVDRHGEKALYLLLDLRATGNQRMAVLSGLGMVLERVSATRIERFIQENLVAAEREMLLQALNETNPGANRTVGLTLFDIWTRFDRDRETFDTGRRLWLNGWSREFVLKQVEKAIEHGKLDQLVWSNAGTRLQAATNLEDRQAELLFFMSVSERRGRPEVARTLLTISEMEPDAQLWLFVRMLELELFDSLDVLLAKRQEPVARVLAAWSAARKPGADLTDAQWAAIEADLKTEEEMDNLGTLLALYKMPQAEGLWRRILKTEPQWSLHDAQAYQRLGVIAEGRAQFAEAADYYEDLLECLNRNARANRREGAIREQIKALRELARPENKDYATLLANARAATVREDYAAATTAMDAALAMRPEELSGYLLAYDISKVANDIPRAMAVAAKMAPLEPQNAMERLQLAYALVEIGELEQAEPMVRKLIAEDPRQAEPLLAMSELEERRHDYNEAISLVRRAIVLGANDSAGYRNLAQLYAEIGDWKQAESAAESLLQVDPDSDYGQLWLYIARARQQRVDRDAVGDYMARRGEALDPWPARLLAFYAGTLPEADLLVAAKTATTGQFVDGQLCEAYFYAGQQRLIEGDTATAKAYFQEVVKLKVYAYVEHVWAEAELRKLEKPE